MIDAIDWMDSMSLAGANLKNLDSLNLATLIDRASQSFGSYTGGLRSFINMTYNIHIDAPGTAGTNVDRYHSDNKKTDDKSLFRIMPVPVTDQIMIMSDLSNPITVQGYVYDIFGSLRYSFVAQTNSKFALDGDLSPGAYIIEITTAQGHAELHRIIKQ